MKKKDLIEETPVSIGLTLLVPMFLGVFGLILLLISFGIILGSYDIFFDDVFRSFCKIKSLCLYSDNPYMDWSLSYWGWFTVIFIPLSIFWMFGIYFHIFMFFGLWLSDDEE